MDLNALMRDAERVVREATDAMMKLRGRELQTTRKDLLDVVTEADLASERILIDGLRKLTPSAAILAEEAGASGPEGGARWIIDPLDGTVNYAGGLPWFSATIAYQERGETLLGFSHAPAVPMTMRFIRGAVATIDDRPARCSRTATLADAVVSVILTSHFSAADTDRTLRILDRLSRATRGVRIIISGAYEMALVASAQLDAFVSIKADIVSHAASMPLVRAGGGRVTTLAGTDSRDEDLEKIASNGKLHEELLEHLQGI